MQNWDPFLLTIPGLQDKVEIQFPKQRLPVCVKCKQNYKTRKLCRERRKHNDLPWRKTYICITLNRSCFSDDYELIDRPFLARNTNWQPYQYKDWSSINSKIPMCRECKGKNYTRSYCRERKYKHRDLPWETVYVELYPKEKGKPQEKNAEKRSNKDQNGDETSGLSNDASVSNTPGEEDKSDSNSCEEDAEEEDTTDSKNTIGTDSSKRKNNSIDPGSKKSKSNEEKPINVVKLPNQMDNNFSFKVVDKSRTFLVEVSHYEYNAQWLDLDENRSECHQKKRSPLEFNPVQVHMPPGFGHGNHLHPATQYNPYPYFSPTALLPQSYNPQFFPTLQYLPPHQPMYNHGSGGIDYCNRPPLQQYLQQQAAAVDHHIPHVTTASSFADPSQTPYLNNQGSALNKEEESYITDLFDRPKQASA